jgi:hypothetical protein
LNGSDNPVIGAAAADIPVHVADDLIAGRFGVFSQQFRRLHDLTGLAISTLGHLFGDPRLLQWVIGSGRQTFNRSHLFAGNVGKRRLARPDSLAVNMDRASAAKANAATIFCSRKLEMIPDGPKQWRFWLGLHRRHVTVNVESDHDQDLLIAKIN